MEITAETIGSHENKRKKMFQILTSLTRQVKLLRFHQIQEKKMSKPKAASTPKKRAQGSRQHDVALHEYDSISDPSESENQKLCKEFEKVFNIALRGREKDPLSEFMVETVPRIFEFLSFREAAPLNDSSHQAREENFAQQIDQIYNVTKAAIIRDNQEHDLNQSQPMQDQSHTIQNHSNIQPSDIQEISQTEPTITPSTENPVAVPSEMITRSKSRLNNAE